MNYDKHSFTVTSIDKNNKNFCYKGGIFKNLLIQIFKNEYLINEPIDNFTCDLGNFDIQTFIWHINIQNLIIANWPEPSKQPSNCEKEGIIVCCWINKYGKLIDGGFESKCKMRYE